MCEKQIKNLVMSNDQNYMENCIEFINCFMKKSEDRHLTLRYLATHFSNYGKFDDAIKLYNKIEDKNHQQIALKKIIADYAFQGKKDDAIELLENSTVFSDKKSIQELIEKKYQSFLEKKIRDKEKEEAIKLEEDDEEKFSQDLYSGDYDKIVGIFLTKENLSNDLTALINTADKFLKSGKKDKLRHIFKKIFEDSYCRAFDCCMLGNVLLKLVVNEESGTKIEKLDKALQFSETIKDAHRKLIFLAYLSAEYNKLNKKKKAIEILNKSISITKKMEKSPCKRHILLLIAEIYLEFKMLKKSINTVLDAIYSVDEFCYPSCGQPENLHSVDNELLNDILNECIKKNIPELAFGVVEYAESNNDALDFKLRISDELVNIHKIKEAFKVLDDSICITEGLTEELGAWRYAEISFKMAIIGEYEDAIKQFIEIFDNHLENNFYYIDDDYVFDESEKVLTEPELNNRRSKFIISTILFLLALKNDTATYKRFKQDLKNIW